MVVLSSIAQSSCTGPTSLCSSGLQAAAYFSAPLFVCRHANLLLRPMYRAIRFNTQTLLFCSWYEVLCGVLLLMLSNKCLEINYLRLILMAQTCVFSIGSFTVNLIYLFNWLKCACFCQFHLSLSDLPCLMAGLTYDGLLQIGIVPLCVLLCLL